MLEIYPQLEEYATGQPYSYTRNAKDNLLLPILRNLLLHHYSNCFNYRNILDALEVNVNSINSFDELPFLPVRLFKDLQLLSIPAKDVIKHMTSSGTTGQQVSNIYLDKSTSMIQKKILIRIVSNFLGSKRRPMIIIDSKSAINNRDSFSARTAGVLGFSSFATEKFFALNDDMSLDTDGLLEFIAKHTEETVFVFGFTSIIWQHFIEPLFTMDLKIHLPNSVLLHGGGWKKLVNLGITSDQFRRQLTLLTEINQIHDYYGMVEQTGSIFVECNARNLHTSNFSHVIIRDPHTFSVLPFRQRGLIEVISMAPGSYPGHVLLTEDIGEIVGEDDCVCGRLGRYFKVHGRLENAEIRGCSDTYSAQP